MTSDGRQNDTSDSRALTDPLAHSGLKSPGRRRFGKSGMAASGVLATLASGPVLGGPLRACTTPSGSLSGGHSTHGTTPVCAGRTPGYWKNHTAWPIINRSTVRFDSVFNCSFGSAASFVSVTMLDVLTPKKYDKDGLGRHLVAAYLNIQAQWSPFQTVGMLQAMWNEIEGAGVYHPTAGVNWSGADVVTYLKTTMPL